MNEKPSIKKTLPAPGMVKRKSPLSSQADLVRSELLYPERSLPLLVRPGVEDVNLLHWAADHRETVEQWLLQYGAILFRGFAVPDVAVFGLFIGTVAGALLEYKERSSPRSQVSGYVYTSTDHPQEERIVLHNENSYQRSWPLRIFFYCHTPAQKGGETPIADVRRVYQRLDPELRERFQRRQVMYVRNFGDGFGLPWETVFQTSEVGAVEDYCRAAGMQWEWKEGGRLRTRSVGQATIAHPETGEMLWFNHAMFFHVTTLSPQIRSILLSQFTEEELPNNSYYGDGSPIEAEVMDALREAYEQETVSFSWQKGDILMLDNMLVAHGRASFEGTRRILTGMSNPFQAPKVIVSTEH